MDAPDDARVASDGGDPEDEPAAGSADGSAPADAEPSPEDEEQVNATIDVRDGRTVITISGQRDAAVIVESASGEQIYLPPEEFGERSDATTAYDSPYDGTGQTESVYSPATDPGESVYSPATDSGGTESVYGRAGGESHYSGGRQDDHPTGLHPTPDGVRIVHPEPVTDVRIVR